MQLQTFFNNADAFHQHRIAMFNLPSNVVTWRDSADMFASKLIDATSLLEVYPLATNAFFAAYIYDYLAANPTITSDTSILTSSLNNLIIPSSYATLNDYLNALYALYSIPLSIVTQSNATNDFIFNAIASTAFNQGQLALLTSNAGVPNFIPANASALTSCNGILVLQLIISLSAQPVIFFYLVNLSPPDLLPALNILLIHLTEVSLT
ncbi:MAG: hypothetical protein COW85_05700 [Ignavibacteria bacterium CG22_combo_CG10-13_8_21_14_all_37_15]|nr:MAG: hypothetical protein COW85_05700 [Ignavibacteria bacterium CG22_combo_CG10-13_8_21_14_all_37_15]